jgi:sorbitol/mannitol transport system permease protein
MRSSTPPPAAATASMPEAGKPGGWRMLLQAPAVAALALWMLVPLALTIYFSFARYNLLNPAARGFAGLENYRFLWGDPAFLPALRNTLELIGSVLVITVGLGTLLAVLYERRFFGRNAAALLVIAPFFVMPTVSALVWKNMILHPVYGLLALAFRKLGLTPIDWFGTYPMLSLVIILSWEWLPFAFLILFTSLKSLDAEQKEAAQIDGANSVQFFFHITIPHLRRAMSVVVMIETIFLLSIFAEIYTTTSGGPGTATTNLAYLVYSLGLQQFDVGIASAGGILAVVLANIAAFFLVRILAGNLKGGH